MQNNQNQHDYAKVLENKLALLTIEVERLNKVNDLTRNENSSLKSKLLDYENKVIMMASEIERLNNYIKISKEKK